MMESLDFTSFWGEAEDGYFSHDLTPGDGLDGLFDNLTPDLLFKNNDGSLEDGGSDLAGDFEDWMNLKMEFSFLDCTEDQKISLNDPMVMEKAHATDLATPQTGKYSIAISSVPMSQHMPSYTPPSSPESQVPDVSRPINVTNISCDHNLFASPPVSPNYGSGAVVCNFPPTTVASSTYVEVVLEDEAPEVRITSPSTSEQQFVYVTRQRDNRPHPYAKPQSKAPASSLLKSKVKSASGSSTRAPRSKKDQKERKRTQNKHAATRYREKKRVASIDLETEEDTLVEVNQELKTKVKALSTEISYLKGFMRDMFRARGILK